MRMRDKILQQLATVSPGELRFTEIFEAVGSPSRSVFSEALKDLRRRNLIERIEASYRCVSYRLKVEEYKKWLEDQKKELEDLQKKIKSK
jgi:DNA-binding HxlR family transcriptional regulator